MKTAPYSRNIVVAAVLLVATFSQRGRGDEPGRTGDDPQRLSRRFRMASKRVQPSLVVIETQSGPRQLVRWAEREQHKLRPTSRLMPAHGERRAGQGSACSGTGVIIDERGYIVTCHHVVTGADAVFVKLEDGRRFVAKAINSDPFTDLAVLRIEGAGHLTVATLAPSDKLDVGDWVVSVGTPYGLANSVSAGIVSAVDREIPEVPRTRLIQTDAASNPGNSGGALINLKGELIGITEGSYGASEAFQGITFAIPSDVVKDVVHKLIEHGEVRRAYLGCHTESLTPDIAVCVGLTNTQGVIVTKVAADAPAVDAGIQSGDVLLRFDEASIVDGKVMQEFVEAAVPGRGYTLTILRERRTIAVKVVLSQLPPIQGGTPDATDTSLNSKVAAYVDNTSGLHLDELTPDICAIG